MGFVYAARILLGDGVTLIKVRACLAELQQPQLRNKQNAERKDKHEITISSVTIPMFLFLQET
jgi:hypothetical protein